MVPKPWGIWLSAAAMAALLAVGGWWWIRQPAPMPNHPPQAATARFETQQDNALSIPIEELFKKSQATDEDGDSLQVSAVTDSRQGQATLNNGEISFIPSPGFSGEAGFVYTLDDGRGGETRAEVNIQVSAKPAPLALANQIRLGVEDDPAPPKVWADENGQTTGFDYEIASVLAQRLDKTLVLVKGDYDALPQMLRDNRVDWIMGGYIPDPAQEGIAWSEPYLRFNFCLVVPIGSSIKTPAQLSGYKLGLYKGDTVIRKWANENLPASVEIKEYDGDGWFNTVRTGEVHAILYDCPFAREEIKQFSDSLHIVTDKLGENHYAIGLSSANPRLLQEVNAGVAELKEGNEYKRIKQKYFPDLSSDAEQQPQPVVANAPSPKPAPPVIPVPQPMPTVEDNSDLHSKGLQRIAKMLGDAGYPIGNVQQPVISTLREALRNMQKDSQLPMTGILDEATWEKFTPKSVDTEQSSPPDAPPATDLPKEDNSDLTDKGVTELAESLEMLGFYDKGLDDLQIADLRQALRGFQVEVQLPATGRLDQVTWEKFLEKRREAISRELEKGK
jgi:ABC-type amino acid transport substrate-binding protein